MHIFQKNTQYKPSQTALLTALILASPGSVIAQSFSLDDNPSAPFSSPMPVIAPGGSPGLGAEDPYGLTFPPGNPGLAPSPTLGALGVSDSAIFSPGPALQHLGPLSVPGAGPGGYMNAMSSNHSNNNRQNIRLHFSVDRNTVGTVGDVALLSAANQQEGNIFTSTKTFTHPSTYVGTLTPLLAPTYNGPVGPAPSSIPGLGSNALLIDDSTLGLACGAGFLGGGPCPVSTPGVSGGLVPGIKAPGTHDNVDAFDHKDFDAPAAPDGLMDTNLYFSAAPGDPLAGPISADILLAAAGAAGITSIFAPSVSMGLDFFGGMGSDDIDALIVWDENFVADKNHPGPSFEAGIDYALFSLAPGSATLTALGLSDADIFFTDFTTVFGLFASASDLGLLPGPGGAPFSGPGSDDNIDALELSSVPLPGGLPLLLSALAGLGLMRSRKFSD